MPQHGAPFGENALIAPSVPRVTTSPHSLKQTPDPHERFLRVIKWYMSGWYLKPPVSIQPPLNLTIRRHSLMRQHQPMHGKPTSCHAAVLWLAGAATAVPEAALPCTVSSGQLGTLHKQGVVPGAIAASDVLSGGGPGKRGQAVLAACMACSCLLGDARRSRAFWRENENANVRLRLAATQGVKKPYNPILGEVFRASFDHGEKGTTHFVAEQVRATFSRRSGQWTLFSPSCSVHVSGSVWLPSHSCRQQCVAALHARMSDHWRGQVSHHPPVSAFHFVNRKSDWSFEAVLRPKSKFLGNSAASIAEGQGKLTLHDCGEEYHITFPSYYVRGLLLGTMRMEISGDVNVSCPKLGLEMNGTFKNRGYFSGENNSFEGKVTPIGTKDTLYKITGRWDRDLKIESKKDKSTKLFIDVNQEKGQSHTPLTVRPEAQQEWYESRKLWTNVTKGIRSQNQDMAGEHKSKLEDAQRAGKREKEERGETWKPVLFKNADSCPDAQSLKWEFKYSRYAL